MNAEQQRLERFSAGECFAVDPDAIERELAALWREAGRTTDKQHPVTRACLWNITVHLEERENQEGFGQAANLLDMVNELPKHLAARALVLRTRPAGDPELESWISANCILAGGGQKLVCSEEITIAAKGSGDRHLPGLVRALLVPAVPTAAVFAGVPPEDRDGLAEIAALAERLITDVDRSRQARPLARLSEVMARAPLMAMDLGWLGRAPLRSVIAEMFDPPLTVEALGGIDRVHYVAPAGERWSSYLMLGWIASALGVQAGSNEGGPTWSLPTKNGRELALVFDLDDRAPGPRIEFTLHGRSDPLIVAPVEPNVVEVPAPGGSRVRKPLAHPPYAGLLARALSTRSEDHAFAGAMFLAGEL